MIRVRAALLIATLLPAFALAGDRLTVAVASNFQFTATKIATRFTESTGIDVRIVSGSTGKLYAQIVNGAPYDVFLAADTDRPMRLAKSGVGSSESYWVYATGHLVLWSNNPDYADRDCYLDLTDGKYSFLAMANPNIAPYGSAAREFLIAKGLWDGAQNRLVFGENVSQAFQFVASGNTTMGLIAASQVLANTRFDTSCNRPLKSEAGQPISVQQGAVMLTRSKNATAAGRFIDFMQTKEVSVLLNNSGYSTLKASDGGRS